MGVKREDLYFSISAIEEHGLFYGTITLGKAWLWTTAEAYNTIDQAIDVARTHLQEQVTALLFGFAFHQPPDNMEFNNLLG